MSSSLYLLVALMSYLFVVVGKHDNPLFRLDNSAQKTDNSRHLQEFIIHSSLDLVDELVWRKTDMYFKNVDRFGDSSISAFVTASSKFQHTSMFIAVSQACRCSIYAFT